MRSIVRLTGCSPPVPRWRPRQGHVQRFGLQLALQLGFGQCVAALVQRGLDRLLGHVDGGAPGLLFFHAEGGHALHQLGHAAALAQVLGLGVFQVGGGGGLRKQLARRLHQRIEVAHLNVPRWEMKKGQCRTALAPQDGNFRSGKPAVHQAASLALT
jgi:hypothetical protein